VLEPETGAPFASRTLTGTDTDGTPVILVSALSSHTQALRADPRASLLAGEPGKGDPLAHPRLTVICTAEEVSRESEARAALRERFVRRHPKAKLYVDFPDFTFFRLVPERAFLNGGFGQALLPPPAHLLIRPPPPRAPPAVETRALPPLNSGPADAPRAPARPQCRPRGRGRSRGRPAAAGVDLASGDRLKRLEFPHELENAGELRSELARLLQEARAAG